MSLNLKESRIIQVESFLHNYFINNELLVKNSNILLTIHRNNGIIKRRGVSYF